MSRYLQKKLSRNCIKLSYKRKSSFLMDNVIYRDFLQLVRIQKFIGFIWQK